jgi:serine/threonine protein kinase
MRPERWNKVRTLTREARQRSAHDREAYLECIYEVDPALGLDVISLMEPDETASSAGAVQGLSQPEILEPGFEVGPYQIVSLLGQGGMGRVYQALDPRIGRFVALKFLPEELERYRHIRARFLEEARVAAALDHPFICKIYEIGEHGDRKFIAMEYVEGQTLSRKLERDRPGLTETVRLGIEIADALENAHQKSVIHRDLKPQNIMITTEGHIKLMDFGLARRVLSSEDTEESWRTNPSGTNLLVGTLAYMSPEQFYGEAVDHRSDIFTFGIILYELLTGTYPFRCSTKLETANSISNSQPIPFPDESRVPKDLQRVVMRMLEKDPADRHRSVREVRHDLVDVQNAMQAETADWEKRLPARWVSLAVVASIVVLVGLILYWSKPFRETSASSLNTSPLTSYPRQERWPSFSPDGKRVVFGWNGESADNNFDLYTKTVGSEDLTRLTIDSAQDMYPDWSPDGTKITFARLGGRTDSENGLFLVPASGGPEMQLREGELRDPHWSPDARHIAFAAIPKAPATSSRIYLLSTADLKERQMTFPPANLSDTNPVYSPDGHLLAFVRWTGQEAGDVYLVDMDSQRVRRLTSRNRAVFGLAWGEGGREIIFASNDGREGRVWKVPVSGGEPVATEIAAEILSLSFSPARHLLAYEQGFNELNIWRMPGPQSTQRERAPRQLITSTQEDLNPDYSPDGRKILFSSRRTGSSEIWMSDSDGQNLVQLTSLGQHSGSPRWSPDGRRIAFDSRREGDSDIFVTDPRGRSPVRLTDNRADDVIPSWSRDGKWIYFGSERTGRWEIWKVSVDSRETVRVTHNGGWNAAESPDGRYLYYLKAAYSPLWRKPLGGGGETVVINELIFWPNWKLLPEGIFFAKDRSFFLIGYDGDGRRLLSTVQREPDWDGPQWISLSPDEKWIAYSSSDHEVRDIMLVENFR